MFKGVVFSLKYLVVTAKDNLELPDMPLAQWVKDIEYEAVFTGATLRIADEKGGTHSFHRRSVDLLNTMFELREVHLNWYYRHYLNGNWYKVLHVALHSETGGRLVIYQNVESGEVNASPLLIFLAKVPSKEGNPTQQVYRFMSASELGITDPI
jgi:hypothetical protein